jgi:hypothetical protein
MALVECPRPSRNRAQSRNRGQSGLPSRHALSSLPFVLAWSPSHGPGLDEGFVDALRRATNGGWALGGERFKREIAAALGRCVAPLPLGRLAKPRDDQRQISLL